MTFSDFCTLNGTTGGGELLCMSGAIFPQESFTSEFTLILYSKGGISPIHINGKEYVIRRKCISVLRPGSEIEFHPSEDLDYKVLAISGEFQKLLSTRSMFLSMLVTEEYPVIRITSAYNESLHLFFDAMDAVYNFQNNPYKTECALSILRALFYSTSYYVSRSLKFRDTGLQKFASQRHEGDNSVVSRFMTLVEHNAATTRHLAFYASQLDYNPKYLSALIKRECGYSGQDVIDQYATLAAMSRLSYGHRSIKEISDDMCFQSQSDFGKFFKRMTGMSPLAYRNSRFSRYRDIE